MHLSIVVRAYPRMYPHTNLSLGLNANDGRSSQPSVSATADAVAALTHSPNSKAMREALVADSDALTGMKKGVIATESSTLSPDWFAT